MSDFEEEEEHDFAPQGSPEDGAEDSDADEPDPEPAPAPAADTSQMYLVYNRQYYRVLKVAPNKPGWKRCYNRTVKVPSGKILGQMISGHEGWPRGDELASLVSADKIVVLMGKLKKDDVVLSPVWYLLVEVENVTNKQDHQILRHIPKPIYKEIIDAIKKDEGMAESSLLRMQAHGENRQALNPEVNGFSKVIKGEEPKSAAVMPERPKADPAKKKADAAKPAEKKSETVVPPVEELASSEPDKKPKQSVMSLWKQAKPSAEPESKEVPSVPVNEGHKAAPEPAPKESAPKEPTSKRKAEEPAPADTKNSGMYKKMRTTASDSWEVLLTEPDATIDFKAPPGATSAKVNIAWSFD